MSDLKRLLEISDTLDSAGFEKEADYLDTHISKIAKKGFHKSGLKEETVDGHRDLYEGYKGALEAHTKAYKKAGLSSNEKDSPNDGVLRESLKGMTYNSNAVFLHEMYFADVYDSKPYSLEQTKRLWDELKSRYTGIRNKFTTDLKRAAKTPRNGWVLITYCTLTGNILITIADLHDDGVMACGVPIACIDLWEHAYVRDFGNDREAYFDWWLDRMDWRNVEKRFKQLARVKLQS